MLFEFENVSFSYLGKFPALNDINLRINAGEKIAFLGANGSGKSTLLSLAAGLVYPQKGIFRAFGRVINEDTLNGGEFRKYFRSKVGILFQNSDTQLFCPTVEEELYFGPKQLDLSYDKMKESIDKVAEVLNINKLLDRPIYRLSMGEKRRVAIASILVVEPEVLILDEPTAGLDPRTCAELIDLISLYHQQGKTVISTTQDLHILPDIADKVYILSEAKTIAACGNCEDILSDEALLDSHNLIHVHRHKHTHDWHRHPHRHINPGP